MKRLIKWLKSFFGNGSDDTYYPPEKTGLCCKCGDPIDVMDSFPVFLCDGCWWSETHEEDTK